MFGWGDEFIYVECDSCGSLRIATIPGDLAKYYPADYFSYQRPKNDLRHRVQTHGVQFAMLSNRPRLPKVHFHWASVVQAARIRRSEEVLDVGSGVQGMAVALWQAGHRRVVGIDPFIEGDIREPDFGIILKRHLHEVSEPQDVVVFNHSLEHVEDPLAELDTAKCLLRPRDSSRVVVAIPVVAKAYRKYKTFWVRLEAPRHLFIPTQAGFERLALRAGLRVSAVFYDSDYTQFWQSELYQEGYPQVPLGGDMYWTLITRAERRRLGRRARKLNRAQEGDSAIFILKPDSSS